MASSNESKEAADRRQEKAVEDSFPASDPPSSSGIVGPDGHHKRDKARLPPDRRTEASRPKGKPTDDRHATETAYTWENEERPPPDKP